MNEEYWEVLNSVRAWQVEHEPPGIQDYPYAPYFGPLLHTIFFSYEWRQLFTKEHLDPFIPDFKQFFLDIYSWINSKWAQLWSWTHDISLYIESLWNTLTTSFDWLVKWIWDKFEGLINLIWNAFTLIFWQLIAEFQNLANYLLTPLRAAWDYITLTLGDWFERIRAAIASFMSDPLQWVYDLGAEIWGAIYALGAQIWEAMITTASAASAWIGERITALAPQITEYLRDVLYWILEQLRIGFTFNQDLIVPSVAESVVGPLGWLKDEFTNLMGLAYDQMYGFVRSLVPMTPEKAPQLAGLMFGSAVGFGALAHGIALGVEAIPNVKYMGVHYLSAFAARMGSFGTIAGATMGVMAAVSLRKPFTYYMQSLARPIQPSYMDLMMMAVKPDIPIEIFRKGMAYEGFSDYWISRFQATMYNEPRHFELSFMMEDAMASPEWLFTKSRRAGYTPEDAKIFVKGMLMKVTRTQRQDYYKQAFNAFKEGYIDEARFETYLDDLEIRPEAKELAIAASELAYRTDLQKDLIGAYRTAFRNDLTTEEEFSGSLAALGIVSERVDTMVYLEWVRKTPSALKAERREIEKEWREVQKKYTSVYIESFRRGLIDEGQLVSYLVAIGIKDQVAKATATYEAIKKVPRVKIPEILPPVIPSPPTPPELLE